jgi:hypothetical protein
MPFKKNDARCNKVMSEKMDPLIDALIVGTVVSSLDKIGVNPMLMVRQATPIIALLSEASIKEAIGKNLPSTVEEYCKICEEMFRPAQTADPDNSKLFYSNGVINMKVVDCAYLTMADLGKSLGYKACPVCMQGFMLSAFLKAINLAEVEKFQVEYKGDTCFVKVKLIEK